MIRTLCLCCAMVVLCGACDERPREFPIGFDRMRDQPRYDPYQRSLYFADGAAMRQIPDGAVAVEAGVADDAVVTGGSPETPLTSIPIPITGDGMARGQNRYDIFCRPCHDVDGSANSPVAKNMQLRQPPSLLEPRIRQLPVGRIYQAIAEGYGLMPSYARQLDVDERWSVAAYVRALEMRVAVPLDSLPADVQQDATRALGSGGQR